MEIPRSLPSPTGPVPVADGPLTQLLHLGHDFRGVGEIGGGVVSPEPQDAILVDDDHSSVTGATLIVPQAVRFDHLAVGVEIPEQRIGYVTEAGRIRAMGVDAITAYAQDLGTFLLELAVELSERGDLAGSAACEIEYVKRENHMLLAPILAQADLLARVRRKVKVRGWLSYFRCHPYTCFL